MFPPWREDTSLQVIPDFLKQLSPADNIAMANLKDKCYCATNEASSQLFEKEFATVRRLTTQSISQAFWQIQKGRELQQALRAQPEYPAV